MKHSLEKIDLKCGAKLLLINVPNSNSIYFSMSFRGGFWSVPAAKHELPHLVEHLFFSSNKKYPNHLDFTFEVEKNGAVQNASTSTDHLRFHFICGRNELKSITKLALARLNGPLFQREDTAKEKRVIEKELSCDLEDDNSRAWHQNFRTIMPKAIKLEDRIRDLKNITQGDVKNFYHKFFTLKNTYFVIAGDINDAQKRDTIKTINLSLSDYPVGKIINIKHPKLGNYQRNITLLKTTHKFQSHFYLTFVKPGVTLADEVILRTLNTIYNRGSYSKVFQTTRKKGLSYGVGSGYVYQPSYGYSDLHVRSQTVPDQMLRLFEVCVKELSDIHKSNFSDADLERAKGYVIGTRERHFDAPIDFGNWYKYDFLMGISLKNPRDFGEELKKVTRKDIARVCKKYFRKDNWCLTLVGQNIDEDKYRKVMDKYFK